MATAGEARATPARDASATGANQIRRPEPVEPISVPYPLEARGNAEVVLELLVAEDGSVSRVTLRDGVEPFAQAARRHVEGIRFHPATREGLPVRARILVRIAFHEPSHGEPAAAGASEGAGGPPLASGSGAEAPTEGTPTPKPNPTAPAAPMEVEVLGEQRGELGSIHIPREEARRVPGAFGDPFRVVEVMPGVAPVLSGLPYFYVRGAPPGSVGYLIDGIRIPLLFHVGPGPSVVTPLMIDRVDLYPGAYPARLGRYAGALLEGQTSPPGDRSRAEAQARVFDASAAVEQPFADGRGAALVGGRYSYTQPILAAVAPDYELGYGDYQGRLSYSVSKNDRLSVLAFGGYDLLRNVTLGQTLFDVVFHRIDARWDRATEGGRLRLAATLSSDSVRSQPDTNDGIPAVALPPPPTTQTDSLGVRVRAELEHDLAPEARLRAGADFGLERIQGESEQFDDAMRIYPDHTDRAAGGYADVILRPARGVEIVPGARLDLPRSRGEDFVFFEPRLSSRTRLFRGFAYLAGFGLTHQLPAVATRTSGRRPSLVELSRQTAAQATQGFEYALGDGMLGRTTLFYQHLDVNVPGVQGRSFGVEQFLRRDFTQRLGGFLAYTLSRAEGEVGRRSFASDYDRTHIVSAVLGYDFGAGFRFGLRGYYASGRPTVAYCPTPDCGPGDPTAPYVYEMRVRLPGFFRLDGRFEKRWTFPNGFFITATAEWFNSLLAEEVVDLEYTPRGLVEETQSALTLPSIGVELGW